MIRNSSSSHSWLRLHVALIFALTFVVSTVVPVLAQDGAADASSSIRFVHASPDAPAIDIIVDGQPVAQGLEFGSVTGFASVPEGEHGIIVVPAGEDSTSALIDETIDTDGDDVYTIAVANLLNSLELKTFEGNLDDLPENEARVRLINLSPDEGGVDLAQVGGDEWFDDIQFGDASDHRNVQEGSYDLEIRLHDAESSLLSISGAQIDRGTEVTFVLIGTQSSDSLQVLTLATGVDTACAIHLGLSEADADACVRITHAALDGTAVDVYLEDSLLVAGLQPGDSSDFFAVPTGSDRTFALVPENGSLEDQILESDVDLDEGDATDVIIGGSVSDLKVINDELDLSPVASDQSRLRAVNLSTSPDEIDILVTDGDTLVGGVDFEEFSDEILVSAGTYDIQVQAAGEDDVLFRSEALTIDPEMSYTLIATGSVDSGTFTMLVIGAPAQVRSGEASAGTGSATPLNATTPTPAAEEVDATPTS